jgi:polyphosphate kinase
MTRNLSWRVETVFPLFDQSVRRQVRDIIELQWQDNRKARIIDAGQSNRYRTNDAGIPLQSQLETYFYFKRMGEGKEATHQAAATGE